MNKIMLICLACCGLLHTRASAQLTGPSVVASAGGGGTIGGQSFDYAFGEMTLVNTLSTSNIVVTQGILQPHPPPTGVSVLGTGKETIKVYPNPASGDVYIHPQSDARAELFVSVYDIAGRKVLQERFSHSGSKTHRLNLHSLVAGQYMIVVDIRADGETEKHGFNIRLLK